MAMQKSVYTKSIMVYEKMVNLKQLLNSNTYNTFIQVSLDLK